MHQGSEIWGIREIDGLLASELKQGPGDCPFLMDDLLYQRSPNRRMRTVQVLVAGRKTRHVCNECCQLEEGVGDAEGTGRLLQEDNEVRKRIT